MLIHKEQISLLVIDIQEKLLPAIVAADTLLPRCRWLISVVAEHDVPVVFSEQYPRGLGATELSLLQAAPRHQVVPKNHFSCVAAGCLPEEIL
ncbi:MAG: isochorismatase family protein, partial [Enterobacteriaceae bacterium]